MGWGQRSRPAPIELTNAERTLIEMIRRLTRLRDRAAHLRRKLAKDDAIMEEVVQAERKAARARTVVADAVDSLTSPRSIP